MGGYRIYAGSYGEERFAREFHAGWVYLNMRIEKQKKLKCVK